MLEELKQKVYMANMQLPKYNLVTFTWGNVSEIDEETNLVVIKPSGVPYEDLKPKDMVVVDLDGNVVEGDLNPSTDTKTHLEIYKKYKNIKGVCHTHSTYATTLAQLGVPIKALGTTHGDNFHGDIPVTRILTSKEVENEEFETAKVIIETFEKLHISIEEIPAVLVRFHGPFTFGEDASKAVENALVLELVAKMYLYAYMIKGADSERIHQDLLDFHYYKKHGENASYGQRKKN